MMRPLHATPVPPRSTSTGRNGLVSWSPFKIKIRADGIWVDGRGPIWQDDRHAIVAQLAEHRFRKAGVKSSSLFDGSLPISFRRMR